MPSGDTQGVTATAGLTPADKCRIARGLLHREMSIRARALVCTHDDDYLRPGERIHQDRALRVLGMCATEVAVALERDAGADWARITAALGRPPDQVGAVRCQYGHTTDRWLAGEPAPYGPVLAGGVLPAGLPDTPMSITVEHATALAGWLDRTADPYDRYDPHS